MNSSWQTAVWHMLTNGEVYADPGPDYFVRRKPVQTQIRAGHQLEAVAYNVTLEPQPCT